MPHSLTTNLIPQTNLRLPHAKAKQCQRKVRLWTVSSLEDVTEEYSILVSESPIFVGSFRTSLSDQASV